MSQTGPKNNSGVRSSGQGLAHRRAMDLQARELQLAIEMLSRLSADEWAAQTDCPGWDVRVMYLHVLGACEAAASLRENGHQMLAARQHQRRHGGPLEAALSAVQVRERAGLTPDELMHGLRIVAPAAVRRRTKLPAVVRRLRVAVDGPVVERWTIGYLNDTIYLRDLWMHRIDVARATGGDPELHPEHDGVIVADVVAEWMRRHGQDCRLTLSGPAGGTFSSPPSHSDSPARVEQAPTHEYELDAIEFCRMLSGRTEGDGLLRTIVPF